MESRASHSHRPAAGAFALLAFLSTGVIVSASSNGRIATLDERINGSGRVVVASARSVEPTWRENSHGDRLIVSRVLLDVEETIKGPSSGSVWMDLEGGTLDGYTLRVSDLPELAPGERGVFFLDEDAQGVTTPHLRGQGILKLGADNVVRGSSLRLDDIRGMARARR